MLESIPELCESKNGQEMLFSLNGEAGRALFETCESSCMENSTVFAKAARIIRYDIFQENVKFKGGFSRDKKNMLPIHVYAQHLSKQKYLALLFWYAFTGCDTVSSFNGRGRKTVWNVLEAFPEITDAFARLSLSSADIADDDLTLSEKFVVLLYDRIGSTASTALVNGARHSFFTKKGRSSNNYPPTLNALLQHIYCSILQSRSWRQARNYGEL